MARNKTIEIDADKKSFGQAQAFVEQVLEAHSTNPHIASETMLLFEALFHAVLSQIDGDNAEIRIGDNSKLGRTEIKIGFSGKRFAVPEGDTSTDPEAKIIEALSDKMSCSYRTGYNVIRISVQASAKAFIVPNLIAIALAIIVGLPLIVILDIPTLDMLVEDWLGPLEKLFTNAMVMIGAPMTFFSLLKNATDSFILSERHSSSRRLLVASIATSIVAIVLATLLGFTFAQGVLTLTGTMEGDNLGFADWSLASAVDQIIPSSILEPLRTVSPVPMIVVALLITYALCSIGSSFDLMKSVIDACYDLFSRILHVIMAAFPFVCFVLFLDVLLSGAISEIVVMFAVVVIVFFCSLFLLATYAVRLKAHGIKVGRFMKKLWPLVKENFAIGSAIEAVPYNVRYCAKTFGFSRERLEKELPVMAQTNLDGNCFIIMLLAVAFIFLTNQEVSWINIAVIGLIVLFLSCGAPNQPGSILIGLLIIFAYLSTDEVFSMALLFELCCGSLQNIINVISGVVMVAENEAKDAKLS